jgi:hypothetical protein
MCPQDLSFRISVSWSFGEAAAGPPVLITIPPWTVWACCAVVVSSEAATGLLTTALLVSPASSPPSAASLAASFLGLPSWSVEGGARCCRAGPGLPSSRGLDSISGSIPVANGDVLVVAMASRLVAETPAETEPSPLTQDRPRVITGHNGPMHIGLLPGGSSQSGCFFFRLRAAICCRDIKGSRVMGRCG